MSVLIYDFIMLLRSHNHTNNQQDKIFLVLWISFLKLSGHRRRELTLIIQSGHTLIQVFVDILCLYMYKDT
jgi:hypothetical protein